MLVAVGEVALVVGVGVGELDSVGELDGVGDGVTAVVAGVVGEVEVGVAAAVEAEAAGVDGLDDVLLGCLTLFCEDWPFAGCSRLGVRTGPCCGASRPSTTSTSSALAPTAPNATVIRPGAVLRSHSVRRRAARSGGSAARCAAREFTSAAA